MIPLPRFSSIYDLLTLNKYQFRRIWMLRNIQLREPCSTYLFLYVSHQETFNIGEKPETKQKLYTKHFLRYLITIWLSKPMNVSLFYWQKLLELRSHLTKPAETEAIRCVKSVHIRSFFWSVFSSRSSSNKVFLKISQYSQSLIKLY